MVYKFKTQSNIADVPVACSLDKIHINSGFVVNKSLHMFSTYVLLVCTGQLHLLIVGGFLIIQCPCHMSSKLYQLKVLI